MMMNVNYFSGVALVKALLPAWLERCEGHIVQISSVQGFFGMPGRSAYAATKHAIFGFRTGASGVMLWVLRRSAA